MAVLGDNGKNPVIADTKFNLKDIELILRKLGTTDFKGTEIRQAYETISKLELVYKKLTDNEEPIL
jgi:hypothetical protein